MAEDPWTQLGVAAGSDSDAGRGAYAARLKTLDVDRDPEAFMRLRAAYDAAVAGVEPAAALPLGAPVRDDETVVAPAGRADAVPYGMWERERVGFTALLAGGDTRAAAATLEKLLARGIVPLGSESALVDALVARALNDRTLRAEELDAIATTFGAADVREYADALRWRTRIAADAALGDGPGGALRRFFRRRTRVARALFADKPENLFSLDLPHLRREVEALHRYARRLDGFVDPLDAERKLVRLERWLRVEEIVAVLAFMLIAALWLLAQAVK